MSNTSAIAQLQQRHLLQLEYQEEKEDFRQLTESIGLARKVTRNARNYLLQTAAQACNVSGFF